MAHIEISNLNSAGSDLFAGADSFLTELQPTETTQIFGGYHCRRGRRNWKNTSYKSSYKKVSYKSSYKKVSYKTANCSKPVYCYTPTKKWC